MTGRTAGMALLVMYLRAVYAAGFKINVVLAC